MAFTWEPLEYMDGNFAYRLQTGDGYKAMVAIADGAGWDVDVRYNDGKTPWHYRCTDCEFASVGKELAEDWITEHRKGMR